MGMARLVAAGVVCAGLWVGAANADDAPSLCPAASYAGPSRILLSAIDIYSGDPADNATLAPDKSRTIGSTITNTWKLSPGDMITIGCSYGPRPRVMVPAPAGARTCVAKIKQTGGAVPYLPLSITCK